jgi:hypothetical protein
MGNGVKV